MVRRFTSASSAKIRSRISRRSLRSFPAVATDSSNRFFSSSSPLFGENRQDCAALERRRYGMAIRGLDSRWLNNGNHGLRSRFAGNSKIIELTTDRGATDLWMKSNQIARRFSFRAIWSAKLPSSRSYRIAHSGCLALFMRRQSLRS